MLSRETFARKGSPGFRAAWRRNPDFIDAARRAGIEFLLTRQEATASFMADVTGQITRRPGVCAATLGPGAVNMTLGWPTRMSIARRASPITAAHALAAKPYATHQKLDLNAVYRPFTKLALTFDGTDTAPTVRRAIRVSMAPRMGPVHLALPSDVARAEDRATGIGDAADDPAPRLKPGASIRSWRQSPTRRRPVVILGIDVDPHRDVAAVRAFVDALGLPVFVTPKAKGLLPEDHPLFCGVCAGVAGDASRVRLFPAGGSPDRRGLRAGRVRQAVAPEHDARVDRPGHHRRGRLSASRGGGRQSG